MLTTYVKNEIERIRNKEEGVTMIGFFARSGDGFGGVIAAAA